MIRRLILFLAALWLLGQWRGEMRLEKAVWLDPATPSRQTAQLRGWVEGGEDRTLKIRLADGRPVTLALATRQPLPSIGSLVVAEGKLIAPYALAVKTWRVERQPWMPGLRPWPWPAGQRGRIVVVQVRYNLVKTTDGRWIKCYSEHPLSPTTRTLWGLRQGDGIQVEGVDHVTP